MSLRPSGGVFPVGSKPEILMLGAFANCEPVTNPALATSAKPVLASENVWLK